MVDSGRGKTINYQLVGRPAPRGAFGALAHWILGFVSSFGYPDGFLVTPVSLAISTTRGAILAKGAGSFLENIPIPIVVPKTFVSAPAVR